MSQNWEMIVDFWSTKNQIWSFKGYPTIVDFGNVVVGVRDGDHDGNNVVVGLVVVVGGSHRVIGNREEREIEERERVGKMVIWFLFPRMKCIPSRRGRFAHSHVSGNKDSLSNGITMTSFIPNMAMGQKPTPILILSFSFQQPNVLIVNENID